MKTRKHKLKGGIVMERYLRDFNDELVPQNSILKPQIVKDYMKTIDTKCKKDRDTTSLAFLVKRDVSQSACIRLGIVIEDIFNIYLKYILEEKFKRSNITKNKKGEKQKDILFTDETTMKSIYAELKSNINLDTEKYKTTIEKVKIVQAELEEKGYSVDGYLVAIRYLRTDDIPKNFIKKYNEVKLIGIADFVEKIVQMEVPVELRNCDIYSEFLTTLSAKIEC